MKSQRVDVVNNTAGQVKLVVAGKAVILNPTESQTMSREQAKEIRRQIDTFNLTVVDLGAEQTEEQEQDLSDTLFPDEPESPLYFREDLEEKTAAELRDMCRQHKILVSGSREKLIQRLLKLSEEDVL